MPNLLERRHEQTRAAIADAAVALFGARGFAETTMDDVADAAGVSRRTAYRHFPSKDDLVFEQPRRWLVHFNDHVAVPRPGETQRERCRRGLLAVAQLIQAHAGSIAAAYKVMVATPSLRGYNGRTEDE
ncbi:MAG TPA: helix-turn-helix domain-containing protein, partial [Ilumatobacteraceae bacterium]|nr:helix-turn-helix domain-containing protein [Ilumatobacteraceae bacterium]